jgi:hypothetical protein
MLWLMASARPSRQSGSAQDGTLLAIGSRRLPAMSSDLIPQDVVTRKLLVKVLAALIREDVEKARADSTRLVTGITSAESDDDHKDQRRKQDILVEDQR